MTPHKAPWLASAVVAMAAGTGAQAVSGAGPRFRAQEIASHFGVGYAVASGDVDGDGRTDILAINETDLVWFQAPTWERRVVLTAGTTTPDNVTLAPHDIDKDGRLDVALGAGWGGQNTGTLQWVRQNAPGASPAWEVFPIAAEPTLHRIRWADVDGDKDPELLVAPLHGKGAKGPDWDGPAARVLVFRPPADPRTHPWPMEVAAEAHHIQHNFLTLNLDGDAQEEIVTASKEGLSALERGKDGSWSRTLIGEGAPGEVKLGRVGGRRMLARSSPGTVPRSSSTPRSRGCGPARPSRRRSSRATRWAGPTSTATAATSWPPAGAGGRGRASRSTPSDETAPSYRRRWWTTAAWPRRT
jgi:hypothetical protein